MKLNELVALRNYLSSALDICVLTQEVEKNAHNLQKISNDTSFEQKNLIDNLISKHKSLIHEFENNVHELNSIIEVVQQQIDAVSSKFFADNYELEILYTDPERIRRLRQMLYDEHFYNVLQDRINLHSGWQYPTLEIGCRDGEWTKNLVAGDPLYIADINEEFLESAIIQFPDQYKNRVCKYLIKNNTHIPNLPKNQFGLIFSYNFFNYLSLDSIKQLMIHSFEWLRPGGKIIFTYNNADLPAAAAYAESYFMSYVPKSLLIPMIESIGYKITFSWDYEPAYSLIELSKPGNIKSLRSSQALGEIIRKN